MNKNLITSEQKNQSLQNLLNSNELKSNDKYSKLLIYLYNASIEHKQIKESTIAKECFENDSNYDPSIDSYVRVYLSKLRKKIEHYYLTEGKNEDIKIEIPKGHYRIEFRHSKPKSNFSISKISLVLFSSVLIIISSVSFFLGGSFLNKNNSVISNDDFIWKDLLIPEQKTLFVLGDYYFFSYPFSEDRKSYIRDVEINSEQDLKNFIAQNPQYKDKIKFIYHSYLDEHIPLCISQLLPVFIFNDVKFEFKLASEVQLNDFNNYNIVYIGSYKSLNLLTNLLGNLNFKYEVHHPSSIISFKDLKENKVFDYQWITNSETKARNDYALVIKVKGPNNNTFLFFISEHDFGNISTVKYFTDNEKIVKFESKLSSKYFEALFEAKGIERTDFDIQLLKLNELGSNFKIKLSNSSE